MVRRYLIVRGLRTTDELQQLGLAMAKRYESADVVALIGQDGRGLFVKGITSSMEETAMVEFVDVDPSAGRCMRAVRRVREAYQETDTPVVGWGDETAIGMFLYYWPLSETSVDVVADAIERGDAPAVEAAAESFIATSFGTNLGALATLSADEASDDAAGHAVDGASG